MTFGNAWDETNGWGQSNGWGQQSSSEWQGQATQAPAAEYASDWQQPAASPTPSAGYVEERSKWDDWDKRATAPVAKDDDEVRVVRGKDGTNKVDVWRTFTEVRQHFPAGLVDILTDGVVANFTKPTSIQAYTWPSLMQGEDIIGVAKTGSGKTLAFLLPGFIRVKQVNHDGFRDGPKILVLAPTRELCQQIYAESEKFGEPADIHSACAYGGADKMPQLQKFRRGPHVAIACPGRLRDYLDRGQVRVSRADYFVLDEADRMLDMGFEPQIRDIVKYLPDKRQSLLFTATWPRDVQQIARSICYRESVHIQVGTSDSLTVNADITQHVIFVDSEGEKWTQLQKALNNAYQQGGKSGCLIFTQTKRRCADLARSISDYMRWPSTALHGDMEQRQRDIALHKFKTGEYLVMVATDVCQRGLDVRNVGMVVNWDAPNNAEDYVHRIGRTGRAGEHGDAYTFLFRAESNKAKEIMKLMQKAGQPVPDDLQQAVWGGMSRPASRSKGYGKGF